MFDPSQTSVGIKPARARIGPDPDPVPVVNCELQYLRCGKPHKQTSGVMKQLTAVVKRRRRRGDGVSAGGQQHLGQHSRADLLQMSHSQLTHITEPKIRQDLPSRGTLGRKTGITGQFTRFRAFLGFLHRLFRKPLNNFIPLKDSLLPEDQKFGRSLKTRRNGSLGVFESAGFRFLLSSLKTHKSEQRGQTEHLEPGPSRSGLHPTSGSAASS